MNKKVISSVLAGAIALSTMSVSAFAATADKVVKTAGATTYKVAATLAAPEINVTLPSAVSAVVNPYGVSFEMKGQMYGAQGVTSPLYTIKNNTTASAVSVNVTPTLTVPTTTDADKNKVPTIIVAKKDTEIATNEKPTTAKKTIYAVVKGAAGENVDVGKTPANLILFAASDEETEVDTAKTAIFEDATTDAKDAKHTVTTLMVIPKATKAVEAVEADAENGIEAVEAVAATYGYGQFQLGGDVTDTKVTPWTSADKININLVLDIGPAADPE